MTSTPLLHRDELLAIVRDVRTRWRWKVVLRSVTVLVGAAIGTLLVAAYALEQFRFSPASIISFRVLTYLAFVALGWFFFVRPLARRVTDQQVALYLEEHEPSLQEALVSAVDASATDRPAKQGQESIYLLRRLIESAIERCQQTDLGRDVERQSLRRSAVALGAIAAATALVFIAGPAYLRQGVLAVLVPAGGVEAASPYRLEVTPGDTTVSRGADVSIAAKLSGFTSTEVDLFTRSSEGAPFERTSMVAETGDGRFESTLFGLRESTEYFVQSAGVRSAVFDIVVANLPFVERMEMEYIFPAYTGVPPKTVENGGDVATLRGTTVRLRVHSTLPTAAGRIVIGESGHAELTAAEDGTLTGSFVVTEDGFYRIDLASAAGTLVKASPQYTIDVLADEAPTVTFSKPARDLRATNIDEIFVEAKADDDFGVRQLDLVYSVNGGAERPVRLVGSQAKPLPQVTAGHTFFLEEMGLKPGDVVSYYARATDNDTVQGAKGATSDIFFLQIQPFRKDYRAAESQAGGQQGEQEGAGGAGGESDPSALSDQQRRIVTGTFNVVRDREKVSAAKFREDVVFLALAQGQLRDRAQTLAMQINVRLGDADATMKQVAADLGQAVTAMSAAEKKLQASDPKGALPLEQQALASLQRAEEAYRDVRIRMEQQQAGGGGGGGGGASAAAEELADLFQLELDKLQNQYETFQRSEQQSADNQTDAMLERLRELARRQEQEAERQRQMAGNRQGSGSSGASGARQRQLADETEEAARQLERLSREQGRQNLADAARGLRDAADAMRRAAASGDASSFANARDAAERLRQATSRLDQQRTDRLARDIENALSEVRKLADEQDAVQADVRRLDQAGANRNAEIKRLLERKDLEAQTVDGIERQLDRTASDFRRERPEAAREVQEAADTIRDSRLKEKIQYSKGVVQGAPAAQASEFEAQIGSDIANLEARLEEAAAAAGSPERDRRAEALEQARNLVRGMESMEQRTREQQEQARAQQGAQGRGQQAGEGSRGESGRGQQAGEGGREGEGRGESGRGQGAGGQQGERAGGQQGGRAGGQGGERAGGTDQGQDRGQQAGRAGGQGGLPTGAPAGASGDAHPQDPRQLRREAQERRAEAQALRRELQAMGVDVTDLDALIRELRAFDSERVYGSLDEVASLQSQLVNGFRRFEFDLRRALGDARADQLLLSGSEEVPAEYRKLIEEYYRALARVKK